MNKQNQEFSEEKTDNEIYIYSLRMLKNLNNIFNNNQYGNN